jgi:drug/metabolite transporter (DMT)-like permease
MLVAGLVLAPFAGPAVAAAARERGLRALLPLAVPGILLGLHFHLWVAGVRQTSVATATFIFATNPVLFAVAEVAVYRRRLSAADWSALALAAAGGAWLLAVGGGGSGLAGGALCLAATALYVLYLVASEKVSAGTPHPAFVCLIYLAGGLLTLPIALARGEAATAQWTDGGAWLALAALALLPTLVGHASNTYAVRFFPPILVSFTTLLEPILSSIAAQAVLGERPRAADLPAYGLFAAATSLFLAARWVRGRRRRAHRPDAA